MSVPLAYIGVILIWSTTPLAVKWSTLGSDFVFAITSRTWLAAALCVLLVVLTKKNLPWHRRARKIYFASALGLYGAMMCVYWASQHVPSGVMSVVFGLAPLITGILAAIVLGEKSLTWAKVLGMVLGFSGLYFIFAHGESLGANAQYGIIALLMAALIHSISLVWIKKLGPDMPALTMTCGGLLVACVPYTLTWLLLGGSWPAQITGQAIGAILYLAIVSSVFAFVMMFYMIKHVDASTVALIPLITPVLSLLLGSWLNDEIVTEQTLLGTALILAGLANYHWEMLKLLLGTVITRSAKLLATVTSRTE